MLPSNATYAEPGNRDIISWMTRTCTDIQIAHLITTKTAHQQGTIVPEVRKKMVPGREEGATLVSLRDRSVGSVQPSSFPLSASTVFGRQIETTCEIVLC